MFFRKTPEDTPTEASWRRELEEQGEASVRANHDLRVASHSPDRKFTVRWLREQEQGRETRERTIYWVTIATLWAAGLTLLATIIGIAVTLKH